MKKWNNPEIWDLSVSSTEMYDMGGANDGGYIANPSGKVGSQPCRSVSQGVGRMFCLPKTAWPPT